MSRMARGVPMRDRVSAVAERIPAGSWTNYGEIAAIIDSHAVPVGTCLKNWPIPNAHRILTVKGQVSPGFAFPDGRTDDPVELLKAEGIRFTNGCADPRQRWQPPTRGRTQAPRSDYAREIAPERRC
jgi:alkylated DNA nucleotide flippase Atl1